jgi:hypothetical protein
MELLNEILINMFLFRVLLTDEIIINIPEGWSIFVELSNTFDN